jgi:hypothetical protein
VVSPPEFYTPHQLPSKQRCPQGVPGKFCLGCSPWQPLGALCFASAPLPRSSALASGTKGKRAPVVSNGLVVARLPQVGPCHTAVHVVAQQVLFVLRPVPLHHD